MMVHACTHHMLGGSFPELARQVSEATDAVLSARFHRLSLTSDKHGRFVSPRIYTQYHSCCSTVVMSRHRPIDTIKAGPFTLIPLCRMTSTHSLRKLLQHSSSSRQTCLISSWNATTSVHACRLCLTCLALAQDQTRLTCMPQAHMTPSTALTAMIFLDRPTQPAKHCC